MSKISQQQLKKIAENFRDMYFRDLVDRVITEHLIDQKSSTIAFLVLSRAVYEDISISEVIKRYQIEVTPLEIEFDKNFRSHEVKYAICQNATPIRYNSN